MPKCCNHISKTPISLTHFNLPTGGGETVDLLFDFLPKPNNFDDLFEDELCFGDCTDPLEFGDGALTRFSLLLPVNRENIGFFLSDDPSSLKAFDFF